MCNRDQLAYCSHSKAHNFAQESPIENIKVPLWSAINLLSGGVLISVSLHCGISPIYAEFWPANILQSGFRLCYHKVIWFHHMTSCYCISFSQDGHTALMLAAIDGKSTEIVRLLLEQYKAGTDEKDPVRLICMNSPPPPPPQRKKKIILCNTLDLFQMQPIRGLHLTFKSEVNTLKLSLWRRSIVGPLHNETLKHTMICQSLQLTFVVWRVALSLHVAATETTSEHVFA